MGWTAQKLGLTIVSISNKLSLLIPVLVAIIYMNESTTTLKIFAIFLALVAVVMVTVSKNNSADKSKNIIFIILPLVLFLGSGFNDTIVNYVQMYLLKKGDDSKFVIWIFQFAALIGSVILLIQVILGKNKFQFKNLIAGICLGVPNYFSMYYLVKALSSSNMPSSLLFPINNVSIVLASTIVGVILYKEKLSKIQFLGVALACGSIIILFF
jgi:drug/metabolite transporter (DMT)-like permease